MIRLTGHVMQGLDEFMLRTGHLKVLCNVAIETSPNRYRLERETAEYLTRPTVIPSGSANAVAEYLLEKKLCPTGNDIVEDAKYRYPQLKIVTGQGGAYAIENRDNAPPEIWWQDLCFADHNLTSKVGTITSTAKAGGKTGLSHIFDWAEMCDLVSRSGQLTVSARLLPKIGDQTIGTTWRKNPYILGNEKLLIAFPIFYGDIDVLSRLIVTLERHKFPLKKKEAMALFAAVVEGLVAESESAHYLGSRQQYQISGLVRELEQAAKRARTQIGNHSTTWHRLSSRLETLVDVGILTKYGHQAYEYSYSDTPQLKRIAESISSYEDASDWLEKEFVSSVLGKSPESSTLNIESYLLALVELLGYPRFALHIDSLLLGTLALAADAGEYASLEQARAALEEFARRSPEKARLARGTSGERAEFVNLNLKPTTGAGSKHAIH